MKLRKATHEDYHKFRFQIILAQSNSSAGETGVGKLRFANCNSAGYAICVSCNETEPNFTNYQNSTHSPITKNDTSSPKNERKSDDGYWYILGYQLPYALGIVLLIVVPVIIIFLTSLVLIACLFIYRRLRRRSNESRRPSTTYETIYTGNSEGSSNYAKTLIGAKYENCGGKNYANMSDSSPRDSQPVFIDDKYGYMIESLPRRVYQNDNSYEIPTNSRRRL